MERIDYEDDDKKKDNPLKKAMTKLFRPRSKASYLTGICDYCGERILACKCPDDEK